MRQNTLLTPGVERCIRVGQCTHTCGFNFRASALSSCTFSDAELLDLIRRTWDFVWSHDHMKEQEGIPKQGVHHYLSSDAHVL